MSNNTTPWWNYTDEDWLNADGIPPDEWAYSTADWRKRLDFFQRQAREGKAAKSSTRRIGSSVRRVGTRSAKPTPPKQQYVKMKHLGKVPDPNVITPEAHAKVMAIGAKAARENKRFDREQEIKENQKRARPIMAAARGGLNIMTDPDQGSAALRHSSDIKVGDERAPYGPGSDWSYIADLYTFSNRFNPYSIPSRDPDHTPDAALARLTRNQRCNRTLAATGTDRQRQLLRSVFVERYRKQHGTNQDYSERDFREFWQGTGEVRATSTSTASMGDFAPPVYWLEKWTDYLTAAAPVAGACQQLPLPATGMTVEIPRLTTGMTVAQQASENTNTQSSSPVATYAVANVSTVAGNVIASQQSMDRSGFPLDQVFLESACRDTATVIDGQVIAAIAASATLITNAASSATIPQLWSDLGRAAAVVGQSTEGARLVPDSVFMSTNLMRYFESLVDNQGRPILIPASSSENAVADGIGGPNETYTGYTFLGMKAYMDDNLGQSGSASYAGPFIGAFREGAFLLTGPPILDVYPQTDATQLSVVISHRQYYALTLQYPTAFVTVTGANAYPNNPTFTNS